MLSKLLYIQWFVSLTVKYSYIAHDIKSALDRSELNI